MSKTNGTVVKLNDNERKVLAVLVEGVDDYDGGGHFGFKAIRARGARMNVKVIRLACRSLKRKGLAQFSAGLWTDDGEPAGSGYGATRAGVDLVRAITSAKRTVE